MQNITTSWFVQGMIKATSDAWLKGWDERNGGNLTLRLDEADIAPFSADFHEKPRYIALSQPMPLLANTPFIVTGSGKFFRNVQLDPAANLGVVKIDSDGAGYHILWGLTHEAVPTSELPAHFLSHCARIKATNGKDRVIMHCHATNLIALTYVLENNTALMTRKLWEGSSRTPNTVDVYAGSESAGDKLRRREGDSPDRRPRSPSVCSSDLIRIMASTHANIGRRIKKFAMSDYLTSMQYLRGYR